ncbi:phage tail protein I [Pseudoalteromonas sp. MMG013]|uniref:phage tail protein I n=1 Tax=Pseudoalteromonas sp. MMG013 TaxID=2822687 RepID=UPI001B39611C|nr:phage tail protein I [Pseudoalteromonas sp. MMG013]MBQ4864601.1 phage tail protein I [Pseudoalteromonas sp. MMG013]
MQLFDSMLPPNATKLEKNLEQVIANAIDVEVHIQNLWDPYKCPFKLLPWLAWAYSVEHWEDSWPEHIKRTVVANSFDVHKHKGTPYSLQRALDSLGIRTNMLEWWEAKSNGQPGTMKVLAMLTENFTSDKNTLFTKEMLQMVTEAIRVHKRGSIHFELELGIAFEEQLAIGGALDHAVGLVDLIADPVPVIPNSIDVDLKAYGVLDHGVGFTEFTAEPLPLLPNSVDVDLKAYGVLDYGAGFTEFTTESLPLLPNSVDVELKAFGALDHAVGFTEFTTEQVPLTPNSIDVELKAYCVLNKTTFADHHAEFLAAEPYSLRKALKVGVVASQIICSDIILNGVM